MEYRPLKRTGIHVSRLCLGTMMFGAWGNTDHDDSIRIIHRALDARPSRPLQGPLVAQEGRAPPARASLRQPAGAGLVAAFRAGPAATGREAPVRGCNGRRSWGCCR
jgi:hypothetical protein